MTSLPQRILRSLFSSRRAVEERIAQTDRKRAEIKRDVIRLCRRIEPLASLVERIRADDWHQNTKGTPSR